MAKLLQVGVDAVPLPDQVRVPISPIVVVVQPQVQTHDRRARDDGIESQIDQRAAIIRMYATQSIMTAPMVITCAFEDFSEDRASLAPMENSA